MARTGSNSRIPAIGKYSQTGAPTFGTDLTDLADDLADLINPSVATPGALPLSENWPGRTIYVLSTGSFSTHDGTEWISDAAHMQVNGVNSIGAALVQAGIGKVAGSGGESTSANITFPKPFSSPPAVTASIRGYRNAGSYNDSGLITATGERVSGQKVTASQMEVVISAAGTLTTSLDYYFSWTAIGVS